VLTSNSGTCSGTQSFQRSTSFTIGPPAQTPTGLLDANKNLLILQTDDGSVSGSFSLYTALATTDGVLFQYWVYTATERSDMSQFDLSGQLVDTGIAEAVALNAFVIEAPIIPYQCTGSTIPNYTPIAVGATLTGGISQSNAHIVVTGTSVDLAYNFQATFDGTFASGTPIQLR